MRQVGSWICRDPRRRHSLWNVQILTPDTSPIRRRKPRRQQHRNISRLADDHSLGWVSIQVHVRLDRGSVSPIYKDRREIPHWASTNPTQGSVNLRFDSFDEGRRRRCFLLIAICVVRDHFVLSHRAIVRINTAVCRFCFIFVKASRGSRSEMRVA